MKSKGFCVDREFFENAPRIDADVLYTDQRDAFLLYIYLTSVE